MFRDLDFLNVDTIVTLGLVDVVKDHMREGFATDGFDVSDLNETEAFKLDQFAAEGVVLCDEDFVIEGIFQPLLDVLETTKVLHPISVVNVFAAEGQADAD